MWVNFWASLKWETPLILSKVRKRVLGDAGCGVGGTLWGLGSGENGYKSKLYLLCCSSCFSDIVEVTNENIKKSRRLIIILVRETSGLSWLGSSSEEQIAMYNALVQDGIKIILLELEKIQDYEKMPESIKFIKRKHGALRWSGDSRKGPQSAKTRFWKNVRYRMPVQRQLPSSKCQLLSPATRPDSKEKLQGEVHVPLG